MTRERAPVLLIAIALTAGMLAVAGGATAHCGSSGSIGPPCGEINPRIILAFPDYDPSTPLVLLPGDTVTFDGTLTFTFNAGDEGYVPEDPNAPIGITFSFPRLPEWASMTVEPKAIPVSPITPDGMNPGTEDPTAPTLVYRESHEITLTISASDVPQPTPGYPYAKLQLFAKSSESGIYNPGYGVKEIRVQVDEALLVQGALEGSADAPGLPTLAIVLLAAAVAVARRR